MQGGYAQGQRNVLKMQQGRDCPVWHSVLLSTHLLDIYVLGIVIGIGN